MTFTETPLAGAYVIHLAPRSDNRGWFVRTYDKIELAQIGHTADWVQMNHSQTQQAGAIRGMHFQHPPHAEIKLVRCVVGRVFDVIVDLRAGSPTLGQWFGTELSSTNQAMMYIPKGFAHGFQTLTENCELVYCHSEYYTPASEGAILYNDPWVGINWPMSVTDISDRDRNHSPLTSSFTGLII
ncbi:dTDP-4-dehydrorhamnose 3,5-epimerase [Spirosoma pulveris]